MHTSTCLLSRYYSNQATICAENPMLRRLNSSPFCHTRSKALLISQYTILISLFHIELLKIHLSRIEADLVWNHLDEIQIERGLLYYALSYKRSFSY